MTDISKTIDAAVADAMYLHSMKQAHIRLGQIRVAVKALRELPEIGAPAIDDLNAIADHIEDLMWGLETTIRNAKKAAVEA